MFSTELPSPGAHAGTFAGSEAYRRRRRRPVDRLADLLGLSRHVHQSCQTPSCPSRAPSCRRTTAPIAPGRWFRPRPAWYSRLTQSTAESGGHSGQHGHAGKDGAGATEATDASDFDHVAAARPRERRHDLICRSLTVCREPEVLPLDHLGRPGRQPAHVEVQPERSCRIVPDPVADRRCPNNCAIRKHDIHPLSLGVGAAAGCAPCGVTRLSRLCPERQMSFTTTAKWRVPNEPSLGSYAARHHNPSASHTRATDSATSRLPSTSMVCSRAARA